MTLECVNIPRYAGTLESKGDRNVSQTKGKVKGLRHEWYKTHIRIKISNIIPKIFLKIEEKI